MENYKISISNYCGDKILNFVQKKLIYILLLSPLEANVQKQSNKKKPQNQLVF